MRFKDKVVLITGASRGIGKAEAIAFAREGAAVVVCGRTERAEQSRIPGTIHQTVDGIRAAGGRALAVRCDVTREEDVQAMVDRALAEYGRIDVLINNAAVVVNQPLLETSLKRWHLVIDVNLTATFLCTKLVAPAMVRQGRGSIINTSSGVQQTRSGSPSGTSYIVAKAAIEQFTMMAAGELARHNIAVNCFKPARGVLTEASEVAMPGLDKSGWIGPELMIKAAMFLAEQDARGVTAMVATDQELINWHAL